MAKNPESGGSNPPDNTSSNGDGGSSSTANMAKSRSSGGQPGETSSTASGTSSGGGSQSGNAPLPGKAVSQRKGQYLIAVRRLPGLQSLGLGFQPLSFGVIEQTLRASPDIEVLDTVGPKSMLGALADGMGEAPSVLVARMSDEKASVLHQQAQGRLIVERDQSMTLFDPSFLPPMLVAGSIPTSGPVLSTAIIVLGPDNTPIKDAEVYLFGSFIPATGVTDDRGQVSLSLFGETAQSIRSLYVKPKYDYWSFYQTQPDISTNEANVVVLRPLSDSPSLPNFPRQQVFGWGQKAMRLDQLPGNYRGQGVRIGIIDSGAATTHDDLKKIRFGFDIINKKTNPNTWNEDTVSHGSHCAGVIAGADNAVGVRGFAPDAEVHACKLFPGGQTSQLIDALEYCIEKQIDVVNLSLGGAAPSEALEQQILRAKRLGVACIVAAGNSGGPVQYPASSPNVLAVAAIGKVNEFPADSYHTQTVSPQLDSSGFFSARFTCYGPEIAVCGPGVAIVSSVPANNYAVWDGTSMAAPHITGLAALVLAHHPDFQSAYKTRNAERVERLFQIIKASARRVNIGDPLRTGYGLPDVLAAVGLQPQASMPLGAGATTQGAPIGGAAGQNLPFGAFNLNPLSAMYPDQAQLAASQIWFNNPWTYIGQSPGGPGLDVAYASLVPAYYTQQPQMGGGMQQFSFNPQQPPGYSRQW